VIKRGWQRIKADEPDDHSKLFLSDLVLKMNRDYSLSIIIPVVNEADQIGKTLETLNYREGIEIIIVDGGSQDDTIAIANSFDTKVINTQPGRAHQMNAGAKVATGEMLLFLHGDTRLPPNFESAIYAALAPPQVVAGAFALKIDAPDRGLRWIEKLVNWRSRFLQMPYGDQAIFLKAEIFRQIEGFPEQPIMEDFELIRRLRRRGRIAIVPAPVVTSARRWKTLGILKTTLLNQGIILAYCWGVSPTTLVRWYRGKPHSRVKP
jgi:rSAM/selenodomain-associated transferase 2